MRPHKVKDGRSRVHPNRALPIAATFMAAFLARCCFLVNAVHHKVTHLEVLQSSCLSSNSPGWRDSSVLINAAQSKEVDRACIFIREIGEPAIVPHLRSVEAEERGCRLVSFEQRFKDTYRLKHKVADQLRLPMQCGSHCGTDTSQASGGIWRGSGIGGWCSSRYATRGPMTSTRVSIRGGESPRRGCCSKSSSIRRPASKRGSRRTRRMNRGDRDGEAAGISKTSQCDGANTI